MEELYVKACVPVRKENNEATPDPSEFSCLLKDEQKGKLGGVCWRSLSTKFNHQLNMEKDQYAPNIQN